MVSRGIFRFGLLEINQRIIMPILKLLMNQLFLRTYRPLFFETGTSSACCAPLGVFLRRVLRLLDRSLILIRRYSDLDFTIYISKLLEFLERFGMFSNGQA